MAKVTLEIEDGHQGQLDIRMDLQPAVGPDETGTPAQAAAVRFIEWLREQPRTEEQQP
jgi:hypothetical protein